MMLSLSPSMILRMKQYRHNIKMRPLVVFMLWFLVVAPLYAQVDSVADILAPSAALPLPEQEGSNQGGYVRHSPSIANVPASPSFSSQLHHSPRKALLLSIVVPGAGQIYNGQAWKIPIIYAALGAGGYMIHSFYGKMHDSKTEYLYRINHGDAVQNPNFAEDPTANVYNLYETYNQRLQLSVIVTVALYGLNLLDAFVFGHLYEFEIDDNLSLSCQPFIDYMPSAGLVPSASLTLRF